MLYVETDDNLDAVIEEALQQRDFVKLRQALINCKYPLNTVEQDIF